MYTTYDVGLCTEWTVDIADIDMHVEFEGIMCNEQVYRCRYLIGLYSYHILYWVTQTLGSFQLLFVFENFELKND